MAEFTKELSIYKRFNTFDEAWDVFVENCDEEERSFLHDILEMATEMSNSQKSESTFNILCESPIWRHYIQNDIHNKYVIVQQDSDEFILFDKVDNCPEHVYMLGILKVHLEQLKEELDSKNMKTDEIRKKISEISKEIERVDNTIFEMLEFCFHLGRGAELYEFNIIFSMILVEQELQIPDAYLLTNVFGA